MHYELFEGENGNVIVPKWVENKKLPDPDLVNYYNDIDKRRLYIEGEIGDSTVEIIKDILRFNDEDRTLPPEKREPIKIFINSIGGSVQVMLSVMNAILISKTPVYTIVLSEALSAAACILVCGHKRFAMPGATILVHSGSCQLGGTRESVESAKKYYDAQDKTANEIFLSKTSVNPRDLKKRGAVDWYMSASEALELNIIDKIVDDFDEVLV